MEILHLQGACDPSGAEGLGQAGPTRRLGVSQSRILHPFHLSDVVHVLILVENHVQNISNRQGGGAPAGAGSFIA
jgi:hypothetical protein